MAHRMKAVSMLRPRLKLGKSTQIDALAGYIEGRTGINKGNVYNVLFELQETIIHHNRKGLPVKFPGLGIFTPAITLDGTINTKFRQHSELRRRMDERKLYQAEIMLYDNIGKSVDELITIWNTENPDDQVIVP